MVKPGSICFGLLAGGRSSRMGVDKATLLWHGKPLWQHQLRLAEDIQANEVLISSRPDGPYHSAARVIPDEIPDCGPLGGVTSLLASMESELLLVLAVDMPLMDVPTLKSLVRQATRECGIVPVLESRVEPLAAVYPRRALPLAERARHAADRSMQSFVQLAVRESLVQLLPVADNLRLRFANLNTAEEWRDAAGSKPAQS